MFPLSKLSTLWSFWREKLFGCYPGTFPSHRLIVSLVYMSSNILMQFPDFDLNLIIFFQKVRRLLVLHICMLDDAACFDLITTLALIKIFDHWLNMLKVINIENLSMSSLFRKTDSYTYNWLTDWNRRDLKPWMIFFSILVETSYNTGFLHHVYQSSGACISGSWSESVSLLNF